MKFEWDEAKNRMVFVAFVHPSDEVIRIISLRKADYEEEKDYEKAIQDGLEAG